MRKGPDRELFDEAHRQIGRGDWNAAVQTMAMLDQYWIAGIEDIETIDELLKRGASPDQPDPFGRIPIEMTRSRSVAAHLLSVGANVTEPAVEALTAPTHRPQMLTGVLRVLQRDGPPSNEDIINTAHTFVHCQTPNTIWTACFGGLLARWTLSGGDLSLHSWVDKGWDFIYWIGAGASGDTLTLATSDGPVSFDPTSGSVMPAAMPAEAYFPYNPLGGIPYAKRSPTVGESLDVEGHTLAARCVDTGVCLVELEVDAVGHERRLRVLWESDQPDAMRGFHLCRNRTTKQLGIAHNEYYWDVPGRRDHYRSYLSVLRARDGNYHLDVEHELERSHSLPARATGSRVLEFGSGFIVAAGETIYRTSGSKLATVTTTGEAIGAIDRCDDHIIWAPMSGGLHATAM